MSGAEIMKERAARSSEPSSLRSSGAPSAWASWRALAGDIKLHHSVFALPFAVLGAFMAAAPADGAIEGRRFGLQLALVVPAMVLARSAAMFANRLLDRELDARNPRTAGRAIPSGRATAPGASLLLALCAAIFLLVCAGFGVVFSNWWPLALGLPVLAWICLYPLAKRFTALCHV